MDYNIINNIINDIIKKTFINLDNKDKEILIKYLLELINYIPYYFDIKKKDLLNQLVLNNNQDIYSFLILLLPYFEFTYENCAKLLSLNDIFINDKIAKDISSSYYVDHKNDLIKKNNYLEYYFKNSILNIKKTFKNISYKLLPNWLNIFPYTEDNYQESEIYKYHLQIYKDQKFELLDDKINYNLLYGCLYNFLYIDIKPIKWMIFDQKINNDIYPFIVILSNKLNIQNIVNEIWDNIDDVKKEIIKENWIDFISDSYNFNIIKSLILFYLRWENDQDMIKKLNIDKNCLKIIKTNLEEISELNDKDENIIFDDNVLSECIKKILFKVDIERLYNYIFYSIQQFKYTWYGSIVLDNDKKIISIDDYKNKLNINIQNQPIKRITLKNVYNYIKSLLHIEKNSSYELLSKSYEWDSLDDKSKEIFINRLNNVDKNWFNIRNNLRRVYGNTINVEYANDLIEEFIYKSNLFIDVIFQTLVYNGMFSYFKYNPKITDNKLIPDKNREYKSWEKYIFDNIEIKEYDKSYHFLTNNQLEKHEDCVETILKSKWYTNFGANWVAQIQVYHHYIHQRVLFITGATGAGKSTVAPIELLYAVKMINYNNNARVYCTVPRIQPAEDNSNQMSSNVGIKLSKESYINYIQYKYQGSDLVNDEYYHPCLRLYTDGFLYNLIKSSYLFKKNGKKNFISKNICDVILVDEAHEHNKYMDMILTISKFGTYINNQITLGIISATMDNDELIYRKYFECIDDNWKWPLNNTNIEQNIDNNVDRNIIDRRVHLSVPFGGMNFEVKEEVKEKVEVKDILNSILSKSTKGDILIFLPDSGRINKLVKELNKITPSNILAIPFYGNLQKDILNDVKDIATTSTREKFNQYPKDFDLLDNIKNIKNEQKNSYDRFIIIATNIAEASITINTLEYVIDTGDQLISLYNVEKNIEEFNIQKIATPNRKQRKGRVGRVKPGTVYYTYNPKELKENVEYKICTENINDLVLNLIKTKDTKEKFKEEEDPYVTDDINKIPEYLKDQYTMNKNINMLIRNNKKNIIYPYTDGKYNIKDVIDEDGKLYIIHPDENKFERDIELQIINKPIGYKNKVEKVIKINIENGYIINDNITEYCNLILKLSELMVFESIYSKLLLDVISYNNNLNSELMKDILLFIIFKKNENIKLERESDILRGNADFLILSSIIRKDLLNDTDYTNVDIKLKIIDKINKDINYLNIKKIINLFYDYKLKLTKIINKKEFLKELTEIKEEEEEKQEKEEKEEKIIKEVDLTKNKRIEEKDIIFINNMNCYDQLCYFIVKNFSLDLLLKIKGTEYYTNYINLDVNNLYKLMTKYNYKLKKQLPVTKVSNNLNNYLIIKLDNDLTSIMTIPIYLLKYLKIKIKTMNIIENKNNYIDNECYKLNKNKIINYMKKKYKN